MLKCNLSRLRDSLLSVDEGTKERLAESNLDITPTRESEARLAELRSMYERHAEALSRHLVMPLPAWTPPAGAPDNWQTMA